MPQGIVSFWGVLQPEPVRLGRRALEGVPWKACPGRCVLEGVTRKVRLGRRDLEGPPWDVRLRRRASEGLPWKRPLGKWRSALYCWYA